MKINYELDYFELQDAAIEFMKLELQDIKKAIQYVRTNVVPEEELAELPKLEAAASALLVLLKYNMSRTEWEEYNA